MTREENLHWIDQEIKTWENECQSKHPIKEALYAARKALEKELCEDAISRKEVRDTIFRECSGENLDIDFAKVLLLQRAIKALPPVTPQEPILDKIREEIGKAWHTKPKNRYEEGLKDQALKDMQIIDKYMIESEG